ncbi:DUF4176 domain-containing protein [Lentibacillus sp. L22]|uniref:DUF4176 domain-containing protein n=1 Tax=Lentibacillus sp. L22 TaxID=3163028 RepID=UPI0034665830
MDVGNGDFYIRKYVIVILLYNYIEGGNELLPIGTVVILNFIAQTVMIYGRKQQANKSKIWDYVACPYPPRTYSR